MHCNTLQHNSTPGDMTTTRQTVMQKQRRTEEWQCYMHRGDSATRAYLHPKSFLSPWSAWDERLGLKTISWTMCCSRQKGM
mmetsp:Transcript_21285/g.34069  ORF Transcript_21285/g.34069 Transcript_21285/m.34069 type:complete len:81 (-) Transcript_21285:1623-1865(-)